MKLGFLKIFQNINQRKFVNEKARRKSLILVTVIWGYFGELNFFFFSLNLGKNEKFREIGRTA